MMARDYLAIPGSSVLAERAFSLSGRTDRDPTRRTMGGDKFGALQRLKSAYLDGRLSARDEAWMQMGADFAFNTEFDDSESIE